MGLLKKLFTNCACPQGRMGRAMLKFMNLCHAPLTNWGLKLVDIQDGWTMLDIGCGGGATLQRLLKRSKGISKTKPRMRHLINVKEPHFLCFRACGNRFSVAKGGHNSVFVTK